MLPGLLLVFLGVVVVGGLPALPRGSAAAQAPVPAWMRLAGGGVFPWSRSRGGAGRTPSPPPELPLP